VNRYETYIFLGKMLSLDACRENKPGLIRSINAQEIDWQRFVGMADHHLVLQALYPKIRDHGLSGHLPDELTGHLKNIFDLTTERNVKAVAQAKQINQILKAENIIPVFLKGTGNILDGLYRYPGERILHDIDILVQGSETERAAASLFNAGYKSNYSYEPEKNKLLRHYPILYKPGEPLYVEIHRIPTGRKYLRGFSTETVISASRPSAIYPECLVMADEHKIIHNFLHAQMDHKAHLYGRESMRNLYDMHLLSRRCDAEAILHKFGRFKRISSAYLDITYLSFGSEPEVRKKPFLFLHGYLLRYKTNLRFRWIDTISVFLIRSFYGIVIKPIRSIGNKELRKKLVSNLFSHSWYKKQNGYYRRLFGLKKDN
jgi:hypothetical protein